MFHHEPEGSETFLVFPRGEFNLYRPETVMYQWPQLGEQILDSLFSLIFSRFAGQKPKGNNLHPSFIVGGSIVTMNCIRFQSSSSVPGGLARSWKLKNVSLPGRGMPARRGFRCPGYTGISRSDLHCWQQKGIINAMAVGIEPCGPRPASALVNIRNNKLTRLPTGSTVDSIK